jgi:hypothetical protein
MMSRKVEDFILEIDIFLLPFPAHEVLCRRQTHFPTYSYLRRAPQTSP